MGFGYDEPNVDYKVVKVLNEDIVDCVAPDDFDYSSFQPTVKVYSLRRDSWRIIAGVKDWVTLGNGTYVNGKILWATVKTLRSGEKWEIVSLDMASDECGEVEGPCYDYDAYRCRIRSFGGSLSMLFCEYMEYKVRWKVDLWVMDKYGVQESWSIAFSVPFYHDVNLPAELYYFEKVVCILGDFNEIVLAGRWLDRSWLIIYHTKKKEFRNIELNGGGFYHDCCVYVESLVPL